MVVLVFQFFLQQLLDYSIVMNLESAMILLCTLDLMMMMTMWLLNLLFLELYLNPVYFYDYHDPFYTFLWIYVIYHLLIFYAFCIHHDVFSEKFCWLKLSVESKNKIILLSILLQFYLFDDVSCGALIFSLVFHSNK